MAIQDLAKKEYIMLNCLIILLSSPKNTLIELAAITLPRELSAVGSITEAFLVANTSIKEVPKVTMVMAVTSSFKPIKHPNIFAKSLQLQIFHF